MFAKITSSITNAAKSTGAFLNNNKGKIAVGVAAVGAAIYFREEITEAANGLITKVASATPVAAEVVEATVVTVS